MHDLDHPTRNGAAVLDPSRAVDPWTAGPVTGAVAAPASMRDAFPGWFRPRPATQRAEITSPEAAAAVLMPALAGADRERCVAAYLDTKHRLLAVRLVSVGSIDHTFMAPREILRDALLVNASATVVAHNHPSGDAEPSADDERITRRLIRAGEFVGIEVLDHLVVGGDRWVSLTRRGNR